MTTIDPINEWSKESIIGFLEREELAYQKIDLPYGLSTPGKTRPELCDIAFGDDLSGKSVLDVGSYLGYFSLAACERGASKVVGLEVDPIRAQQAETIAQIKGFSPEYRVADIETVDSEEQFDIVLCLNVLHHMFDPVHVLHKLIRMTRQTLVLEVAGFGSHDAYKLGFGCISRQILKEEPIIYVSSGLPLLHDRSNSQKFFFSREALENILNKHHMVFSRVEVIPSSFKNRFIIRATRRRIGHLIVVAGPTSSGKSTFMRMLSEGKLAVNVAAELPADVSDWPQVGAARFLSGKEDEYSFLRQDWLDGLVFHYDILRPYRSGTHSYERDQALDLLKCAQKVTVVNLRPDNAQLVEQLISGELDGKIKIDTPLRKQLPFRRLILRFFTWLIKILPDLAVKLLAKMPGIARIYRVIVPRQQSQYHKKLLTKYQQPRWIEGWYQHWVLYLQRAIVDVEIVEIKPEIL